MFQYQHVCMHGVCVKQRERVWECMCVRVIYYNNSATSQVITQYYKIDVGTGSKYNSLMILS